MACKATNDKELDIGSCVPFEALKLLQTFNSSGLSARWRLSNWNGILSLLIIWGGRRQNKKSPRSPNKATFRRKRSIKSKKVSTRKRSSKEKMRDTDTDLILGESSTCSGISNDDVFTFDIVGSVAASKTSLQTG